MHVKDLLCRELTDVEKRNAPSQIYAGGDVSLVHKTQKVAIIGTRKPSENGIMEAISICKNLIGDGITIVSGLAAGIDTIAHRSALMHDGKTVAVLGTPLDRTYPYENRELQQTITESHLVVSQFEPGAPVSRQNFVTRNKTIALLSDAAIVVEAGDFSGTVHVMREMLRLKKPVFLSCVVEKQKPKWLAGMARSGAKTLLKTADNVSLKDIVLKNGNSKTIDSWISDKPATLKP